MPLVAPFRTSFGVQTGRDVLLVRAVTADAEGWGECVAMSDPLYSSEYVDAAARRAAPLPVPALAGADRLDAESRSAPCSAPFKGHRMAKCALETGACWTRNCGPRAGRSARELGAVRDRVPCGVSVGIMDSVPQLLDAVGGYLDAGYLRIKLKIEPGWDVEPVRAVRERFGDDVLLQVDANTAYTLADARQLARLDAFDLLLIEQPLDEDDVLGHAELAKLVRTPICLDESITSARDRRRRDPARRLPDRQHQARPGRRLPGGAAHPRRVRGQRRSPVWCGGMLETGIGRAANVALAALPGFTLPGDTSASDRYFAHRHHRAVRARRRPPRRADRPRPRRRAPDRPTRRRHHGDRVDCLLERRIR